MSAAEPGVPLVSVVLPTRNGSAYLRQSVESCLSQTLREIELVVVDDASMDGTPAILRGISDPRMAVVRNERNLGLAASLNAGFARARGRHLTWTSDDNWYEPGALAAMLGCLAERSAAFVFCDYFVIEEPRAAEAAPVVERLPDRPDLAADNPIGPCFLYSRAVRDAVGEYDVSVPLAEDYDYWIRAAKGFALEHLATPLYGYRRHAASLTARAARGCGVAVAASLVRLKNRLTSPAEEAGRLAGRFSQERYGRSALPVRAAGRLLRTASGGRLELGALFGRGELRTRLRPVLEDYAAGRSSFAQTAAILTAESGLASEPAAGGGPDGR